MVVVAAAIVVVAVTMPRDFSCRRSCSRSGSGSPPPCPGARSPGWVPLLPARYVRRGVADAHAEHLAGLYQSPGGVPHTHARGDDAVEDLHCVGRGASVRGKVRGERARGEERGDRTRMMLFVWEVPWGAGLNQAR